MGVESELRAEFREALTDVEPPITDRIELLASLPNGVTTRFEVEGFSMSVAELATTLNKYQDFPYESVEELVDDVMEALEKEDLI